MRKLRLLVAYSAQAMSAQTIIEYASMLKNMDGFEVSFVHVTHDAVMNFDMNEYDVVFNNYCARHCFEGYISSDYIEKLKAFRGLKVISVQDDGDRTSTLHRAIRECGFHVLITAVPEDTINYGYPPEQLPGVEIFKAYTGYVPENYVELEKYILPLNERPVLLGYRGRDIGGRYGKLGFYKFEIGRRMQEICDERGLKHDISMREEDRIYGMDWYAFTGRCRAVLGTESGSNVWDFDGTIENQFREMSTTLGRPASYEEFMPLVEEIEKLSNIGEISPRHFEAAVLRTPMVLFQGRYSDILEPWVHYIPLEKDFSNVDEVFRALDDLPLLEKIVDRTYEDLVSSGNYTYKAFGEKIGAMIRRKLAEFTQKQLPLREIVNDERERLAVATTDGDAHSEWPTPEPQHKDAFFLRYHRRMIGVMGQELSKVYDYFYSQASIFQKQTSEIAPWAASRLAQINLLCASHPEWDISSDVSCLLDPGKLELTANHFAELSVHYGIQCHEISAECQRVPGPSLAYVENLSLEEIRAQFNFEKDLKNRLFSCMDDLQAVLAQLVQQVSYPYNQLVTLLDFCSLRDRLIELGNIEQTQALEVAIRDCIKKFLDSHYDVDLKRLPNKSSVGLQELSEMLYGQLQNWRFRVWSLERNELSSKMEHFVRLAEGGAVRLSARLAPSHVLRQEKESLLKRTDETLRSRTEWGQVSRLRLAEAEDAVVRGDWGLVEKLAAEGSAHNESARMIISQLNKILFEMKYFPIWMRPARVLRGILRRAYYMLKSN